MNQKSQSEGKGIKCKGQHFFEMLNLISDYSLPTDNTQKAYVICRKCGEIRVVGIKNLSK